MHHRPTKRGCLHYVIKLWCIELVDQPNNMHELQHPAVIVNGHQTVKMVDSLKLLSYSYISLLDSLASLLDSLASLLDSLTCPVKWSPAQLNGHLLFAIKLQL